MKRIVLGLLAAWMAVCCLAGCAERDKTEVPQHTHTYEEKWTYDEEEHWHRATCGHLDAYGDRAAHTFSDGVCTVCGYRIVGMTVGEFAADHAEKARDFARSRMRAGSTDPADPEAIGSEFVWFVTDENNKATELRYLYTVAREAAEGSQTCGVALFIGSWENAIDLKDIAEGEIYLGSGTANSSLTVFSFDKSSLAAHSALADAVASAYASLYGEELAQGTAAPLCRLFRSDYREGQYTLETFDVTEGGYIRYTLTAACAEGSTDGELAAALQAQENILDHKARSWDSKGALVYRNIAD